MKLSLGGKIVILIILIAVILNGTCISVSAIVFSKIMEKEYIITSDSMAATVAAVVDGDKVEIITNKVMEIYSKAENKVCNTEWETPEFDSYAEQYLHLMEDETYIEVQNSLREIQDVSEADCVYTLRICPEEKTAVYIVDAAYNEELVTPGCFDMVEEVCYPYIHKLNMGFPAFITNTEEYGWVVTSCMPIYNSKGDIVCFAAVDLSMNDVKAVENRFMISLAVLLLLLTVIICIICIAYVKKKIIKPINMLSEAAGQYRQKSGSHNEFKNINIHTGDELEVLLGSMIQMEKDIDNYIENLTQTKAQLSTARQQADDMHELAYMDSLTGIRNRLAYDKEVLKLDNEINNGLVNFGIAMIDLNFLKYINDTYGHENGNTAIVLLSNIICRIFAHSPVFRIGGDEFAVILKNNDYNKIESLAVEFNRHIENLAKDSTLPPWEKISAAFGYALFEPENDRCADDVFNRADKNMYERKKQMKAERK